MTCERRCDHSSFFLALGLFFVLAFLVGICVLATLTSPKPWDSHRLPEEIVPTHYIISLTPNFYTEDAKNFTGQVDIEFTVRKPVPFILLHISKIKVISHALFENTTQQRIGTGKPFVFPKNFYWVLPPAPGVRFVKGAYRIVLKYEGVMEGLVGFFKSHYLDPAGKKRYIAYSTFEPAEARRAFPSFDEPQMKAEFTVRVTHRADYFALSNMNQVSVSKVPGSNPSLLTTVFARSVRMSTYLVSFVICDYGYTEGFSNGGKPFRVYAPKHKLEQTHYAVKIGIQIQNFFEKYFNYTYVLPKQDMLALPQFFTSAMEHWGLIAYRENLLLFDPAKDVLRKKYDIAHVVAHELAHMVTTRKA